MIGLTVFDAEHEGPDGTTNSPCVTLADATAAIEAPADDLTVALAVEAIARYIAERDGGGLESYTDHAQQQLRERAGAYVEVIRHLLRSEGWRNPAPEPVKPKTRRRNRRKS